MALGAFWGCFIAGRFPFMEKSTRLVLERLGLEFVDLDGLTCCPEKSVVKNESEMNWLVTAARNLAIAEEAGVDLFSPCNGCVGSLAGAARELALHRDRREEVNRRLARVGRTYRGTVKVFHLLDLLHDEIGLDYLRKHVELPLAGLRVAVHAGCHQARPSVDVNADGLSDLVMGGPESVYIHHGPILADMPLTDSDLVIYVPGQPPTVDGADTNGDGYGDILAGTRLFEGPLRHGVLGTSYADYEIVYDLEGDTMDWDATARSSFVGDANGDGNVDVGISFENWRTRHESYLFDGPLSGRVLASEADVVFLDISVAYEPDPHDVWSAGDTNGDGLDDVGIFAYIFLGSPDW